jgi:hypothetical protein
MSLYISPGLQNTMNKIGGFLGNTVKRAVTAVPGVPSASATGTVTSIRPIAPVVSTNAVRPAPALASPAKPAVPQPSGAKIVTTPSGSIANAATGGVVKPAKPIFRVGATMYDAATRQAIPNVAALKAGGYFGEVAAPADFGKAPAPAAPENPMTGAPAAPEPAPEPDIPFTSPAYESAIAAYANQLKATPEEITNAEDINRLNDSYRQAITGEGDRPIPMEFITGRQKSIEARKTDQLANLESQASLLQAKRTMALDASKFTLETEANKLAAKREANKPVAVAPGTSLINPVTGKTVASGGSLNDIQARDTFYNLAQTYPDAGVRWDDSLSPQANLAAAQKAVEGSSSFAAKNTVYAINPLTGEPTLISKLGGNNAPASDPVATFNNLAPELKSSLNSVAGVQFFDSSKINPAQLPYLQRAAEQLGIPLMGKDDAALIQADAQKYNTAKSLMASILDITPKVITAGNDPVSMTKQAAYLSAIKAAPTFSTNNNAKALLATLEAFTSLLTRAAGEKGVLTDTDVRRIKNALPSITDNKELALQKAKQLDDVFRATLEGSIKTYIGGVTDMSGGNSSGGGFAEEW